MSFLNVEDLKASYEDKIATMKIHYDGLLEQSNGCDETLKLENDKLSKFVTRS